MKKALGWFLLALPFVAITIVSICLMGLIRTALVWALTAGIWLCVSIGTKLVQSK